MIATIIPILASAIGPLVTQAVKRIVGRLPGPAVPVVHAALQVGGAWLATRYGINPFGGVAEHALVGTVGGTVAYEAARARWSAVRPAAAGEIVSDDEPPPPPRNPWR
jgi:hypothetical protein